MKPSQLAIATLSGLLFSAAAIGHGAHQGGIQAKTDKAIESTFDIVHAKITTKGNVATFHMGVEAEAGSLIPKAGGKLAGASAFAYVWPTSIDSGEVGFDAGAGILALAVASHPDFDDTPLFDENGDNNTDNDGDLWHSHWVVLVADDACGPGKLKVKDIPEGARPKLPKTWPGLPLYIDSPGFDPLLSGDRVEVKVPFDNIDVVTSASFDGVTSGLRVSANLHAPLFCVVDVFDVASGDLSLPGKVNH